MEFECNMYKLKQLKYRRGKSHKVHFNIDKPPSSTLPFQHTNDWKNSISVKYSRI